MHEHNLKNMVPTVHSCLCYSIKHTKYFYAKFSYVSENQCGRHDENFPAAWVTVQNYWCSAEYTSTAHTHSIKLLRYAGFSIHKL